MTNITQPSRPVKHTGEIQGKPPQADGDKQPPSRSYLLLFVGKMAVEHINLNMEVYQADIVEDPGSAMEMLPRGHYDLCILDEAVFDDDIVGIIREIKRRIPLIPVLVLTENIDPAYQTDLMEAGADDLLTYGLPSEELDRRLRLMLRRHSQNRDFFRRNRNLHAITSITRRLHSATDPYELIAETIGLACSTFGLYGVAIVQQDGDKLHLLAGHEGINRLYDSTIQAHQYDPFYRVMNTNISQIFKNINNDWHYTSIPVLPKAESAIILPLKYQEYTVGAMAVFGTPKNPLNHDDLVTYELFGSQFVIALQNVRHYETQHIHVQSSQHLLRAWQRFITLNSFHDIAHTLRDLVDDIGAVGRALVWLYSDEAESGSDMLISAPDTDTLLIFEQLVERGQIRKAILSQFEDRLQPISLWLGRGQQTPLGPLFRQLQGQQLMVLPVTDSARLIGGVIASAGSSGQFNVEDVNLMESLVHAAGQALERITLMTVMREQTGRLEAILRSINEGIFFVDESSRVAFCNPQFTELTGIKPSEVLGLEPAILLEQLAGRSRDADEVRNQLEDAINTILDQHDKSRDYPIVDIHLSEPQQSIYVELVKIGMLSSGNASWVGIVRDSSRFTSVQDDTSALLMEAIGENIRVPYTQVRSTLATLVEQHDTFSSRERDLMLRQLDQHVEHVGQIWDNFLTAYNLETAGVGLVREDVNLQESISRLLSIRPLNRYRRQIQLQAPTRVPLVSVDNPSISQAISNVLRNALYFSPPGAMIQLALQQQEHELHILIHDQGVGIPPDEVEDVFEPLFRASNNPSEQGVGLGLYLARELVQRNNGRIWIESAPGQGTTVTIALPITSAEMGQASPPSYDSYPSTTAEYAPAPEPVRSAAPGAHSAPGAPVPQRSPQTIMVIEGRSRIVPFLRKKLDMQGYELLTYTSSDEALRSLNLRRLDLILLDTHLPEANGVDICERIRRHSAVPIILMSDEASEPDKVRGFEVGADDYLARPMSEEELVARVKAMFKRQQIPDRTRKPLDLGNLYIDFARREVFLNNKPIELTRIEYDLLHTLAINMDMVLTHKQLLEKVWGPEYQGETQYLWVNVSRLRKKLEPTADSPRYIHNQPGIGYVFRRP